MEIYTFDRGVFEESAEIPARKKCWIDLANPTDAELEQVAEKLKIPLFVLYRSKENFRPRLEIFEDFIALNFKVVELAKEFKTRQVSFFFSENFLISIHPGIKQIDGVKERLETKRDPKMAKDLDYLFYILLDEMIETYFPVLEQIDAKVDALEDEVFKRHSIRTLEHLFEVKRYILQLHKVLWAEREAVLGLGRGISGIKEKNRMYFREAYDHMIQLVDNEEISRDILTGALESYLSVVSNKMNEVMKVLTVIATIFIPMTFITGVYGMNFRFMPELYMRYGYYGAWVVMAAIGIGFYAFFRKKGWV